MNLRPAWKAELPVADAGPLMTHLGLVGLYNGLVGNHISRLALTVRQFA